MTVSQRQALLFYLGYYTGPLDGDWGKGSRAGCEAFQRDYGLTADGLGGPVTDKALVGAGTRGAGSPPPVRWCRCVSPRAGRRRKICRTGGKTYGISNGANSAAHAHAAAASLWSQQKAWYSFWIVFVNISACRSSYPAASGARPTMTSFPAAPKTATTSRGKLWISACLARHPLMYWITSRHFLCITPTLSMEAMSIWM